MAKRFLILFVLITLSRFSFAQEKVTHTYVTISEECPVCIYMTKTLQSIEEKYRDSVKFTLVFPNSLSNYKSIFKFKEKYGLQKFESILDYDHSFIKKHNLTVTPEVLILTSNEEIIYKGRINDGYYAPGKMKRSSISNELDQALELWILNKKKLENWSEAIGCYISLKK